MTYDEFVTVHGITLTATPLASRTDGAEGFSPNAMHYQCALEHKGRTIWAGQYSAGIGIIEQWARLQPRSKVPAEFSSWGGHFNLWEALRKPLPYGKRYRNDSEYYAGLRAMAAKHWRPSPQDILTCVAMDSAGCDIPFTDWAPDYGYSDDSIKAKRIWEACNDTRRALRDGLGQDLFFELMECEE